MFTSEATNTCAISNIINPIVAIIDVNIAVNDNTQYFLATNVNFKSFDVERKFNTGLINKYELTAHDIKSNIANDINI